MAKRVRRGAVWGAAAAACLLTTGAAATPAEAASVAVSGAALHCGAPVLKVWYDSDQFGTYLKAWFRSDPRCPKGARRVENLSGQIYCKPHAALVYRERVAGKTPVEILMKALPPKSKCKSFYAEASVLYAGWQQTWTDKWKWNWGDYPA